MKFLSNDILKEFVLYAVLIYGSEIYLYAILEMLHF